MTPASLRDAISEAGRFLRLAKLLKPKAPAPSSAAELREACEALKDVVDQGNVRELVAALPKWMAAASRAVEEIARLSEMYRHAAKWKDESNAWKAAHKAAEAREEEAADLIQAGYDAIAKAHREGYMCHPAIVCWQQAVGKRDRERNQPAQGGQE